MRVIDLYSVKPIDEKTLRRAAEETRALITVEDHYAEGGLSEAVAAAVPGAGLHILAVRKTPRGGRPEELLDDQDISRGAIVETVKALEKLNI